ncbi:MAG: DUF1015 domain-containing protein [Anaerolineae bacterium]|nr:DUF1015 domain-containing protein [Thermoflexales bacterium]MDW8408764.1 DUF1015 domain-containing protein [Anaerolineae bacterium]
MATIRPFRGIRYRLEAIGDLSCVITQPYDRIHEPEQAAYYALHPYNFVRIELGRGEPDTPTDNRYTRARACADSWLAQGVFMREPQPALYIIEQHFATPDGRAFVRRGITAAFRLARFEEGVILPHERTLSSPKVDRLNLTRATEVAWGHIFVLYPDPANHINQIVQPFLDAHPPMVAREQIIEPAVEQRLWVLDDPAIISAVVEEMSSKRGLIIADGHHRYETALNYRDALRAQHPDAPPEAAFNYGLVTLVSMSDPGLVILPTHRLIHSYARLDGAALLNALQPYFDVQPMPNREACLAALAECAGRPCFGFYDGTHALLRLRAEDILSHLAPERHPSWRALDVAVLHKIVLEHVMGLTQDSIARQENIHYLRDVTAGYHAVDQGQANFLFVLNPTPIEHVRACAEAGETMPQKSTDFYPKIISGWVALPLTGVIP